MTGAAIAGCVIVAENDALFSGIIRALLEKADQRVFLAADGNEAVALARQFEARLVLLDIGMPKLNGLMACEAIRLLPGYAEVPIVMLTGYADERMRLAAMQLGANDFITKPFQPDALMARLAPYLGPSPATPPTGSPPRGGEVAA
jgi:DNA-binding response OmpR family regulator